MTAHWWHAKAPIESMGIVLWNSFHSSGNCLERERALVGGECACLCGRVKVRRGLQWRGGVVSGKTGRLRSVVRGLGSR